MIHNTTVLTLLALGASLAYADAPRPNGNGGAYNGPDLSGQSIPISLDRAITLADLNRSYEVCWTSAMKDIWSQVNKQTFPSEKQPFTQVHVAINSKLATKTWAQGTNEYPAVGANGLSLDESGAGGLYVSMIRDNLPPSGYTAVGLRLPNSKVFPVLQFKFKNYRPADAIAYPSNYLDRFGRVILERVELTKVTLKVPDHFSITQPLENKSNGAPTTVTINIPKLTECLRTEISR